jgi:uncharacterized protein YbaP (TraB family)
MVVPPRLLALLLTFALGSAPTLAAPPTPEPAPAQAERPLALWRVERPGVSPSFLFGTCHMGVSLDEALPRDHRPLVAGARVVLVEILPKDMLKLAQQVQPRESGGEGLMFLPPGQSLRALIGEDQWPALVEAFGPKTIPENLDRLHPFFVAAALGQKLTPPEQMLTSPSGNLDTALVGLATRAGVEVVPLETLDEQLHALLGGPPDMFVEQLRRLLDPVGRQEEFDRTRLVLDACRTGSFDGAIREIGRLPAAERTRMFTDRNAAWLPSVERELTQGGAFVAVGVGHMLGDDGIVAALRERGYSVTQMRGTTAAQRAAGQPVTWAEMLDLLADQLPTLLCSGDNPITSCLELEPGECATGIEEAVRHCGASFDSATLAGSFDQGKVRELSMCAGQRFVMSRLDQLRDTPECRGQAAAAPGAKPAATERAPAVPPPGGVAPKPRRSVDPERLDGAAVAACRMQVEVGRNGRPLGITALACPAEGVQAATRALEQWRFDPARDAQDRKIAWTYEARLLVSVP